jgi:hypothetical protein
MMTTRRILGLVILALGSLFFAVDGFHAQQHSLKSFDFKDVYSGARCLLHHCNPYDMDQIKEQYLAGGGDPDEIRPFHIYNANYPPSALFLATPFAMLPWQPAHLLWLAISITVVIVAAFLMADLCAPFSPLAAVAMIALLMATSLLMIMLAQPAMLTIGLCVIAVWCLLKDRFPVLAIVCFALSLTLKPHIGGLVWFYFLLSGAALYRRRAWQILLATILLSLPGVLWASFTPQSAHWMHDLHVNLVGVAAHGNASDPGPANDEASGIASLQTVVSLFRDDPHVYNPVSWLLIGVLLVAWIYTTIRMKPSKKKDFLGLASIACLALLPIYHRVYDTRLLLLTFPALALLLSEGGITGIVAFLLAAMAIVVMSNPFSHFVDVHYWLHSPHHGLIGTILLMREVPLSLLVLGSFYLAVYLSVFQHESVATD